MDWTPYLEAGEEIRWEGRPAPRCYTFRKWKHALFGFFVLLLTVWWQVMSFGVAREYALAWMLLIPLPFLLCALYLSFGQLIVARLEWEKVFFAVTDRRVIACGGLLRSTVQTLRLDDLTYLQIRFITETLGSLYLHTSKGEKPLLIPCLEHPHKLSLLLEESIVRNVHS